MYFYFIYFENLINLYETEEWRNKLIKSIDNFKNVVALSNQKLCNQLSYINSNINVFNNNVIDLMSRINDLKIDVAITTKVKVEV